VGEDVWYWNRRTGTAGPADACTGTDTGADVDVDIETAEDCREACCQNHCSSQEGSAR